MARSFRLHSIRAGFACNSSSSHSVVLFAPDMMPKEDELLDAVRAVFGWSAFTLVSPEEKRRYAFAQAGLVIRNVAAQRLLDEGLKEPGFKDYYLPAVSAPGVWKELELTPAAAHYEKRFTQAVCEVLRELGGEDLVESLDHDFGVDHQSQSLMATTFDGRHVFRPLFDAFMDKVLEPNMVVLGGNDNGEGWHPLRVGGTHFPWRREEDPTFVARGDGDFVTVFSRRTGLKFRLEATPARLFAGPSRLDTERLAEPKPKRSLTPELVDVKLTDFCATNCTYCYQGSTVKGRHADFRQVEAILKGLAELEVFEVAFGGGEPTAHPQFLEILQLTRKLGIVPNFTTRDVGFLAAHSNELSELIGAVAISVDKASTVSETVTKLAPEGPPMPILGKVQWQVVHGAVSTEELVRIFEATRAPRTPRNVLLLGWKSTGRGASMEPVECDWEKILPDRNASAFDAPPHITTVEGSLPSELDHAYASLFIDTAFQQQFEARLLELGAVRQTLGAPEGTSSCYIDAVAGMMGPSSYCPKKLMRRIEPFPSAAFLRGAWEAMSIDDGARWEQGELL